MSAGAAEDTHIYVEVKELYDSKASLVYENCTKALLLANQTVDSEETVEFLKGYFSKLLQILLDQKIGQFEQGHVEKSLTVSIDILLQMLEPSRDPMLFIDALLKIINYENTYYRGGKVQWQNLPGRPQMRVSLIQRFQKAAGFLKLHALLTSPPASSDDNNNVSNASSSPAVASCTWLGTERLQLILKALTCVDPTFHKAEAVQIRSEVMRQLLTLPEDTMKKESTDFINNLITCMRPKSKNDEFFKTYNLFWLEHTSRMMNCKSILLKLFAWEQMHDITREAARTRPSPSQYIVSNAGTEDVNGVYLIVPRKEDAPANEPPMYRKAPSVPNGKEFTIVRCNMKSQAKWWYLSIVDPYSPGGVKDIDYYQHKSSIDEHSEPPELNWETMVNPVLGKPKAPILTRMARTPDPDGFNETVLRWVDEQKLIEKVFGSGIHREIVSRSKSLVLLLVLENRLAEDSVTAIFRVGMTHQEDDIVEEIFGLLASCSRYMDDAAYSALMGNVRQAIEAGGAENIQRVTMLFKKIHGESLTQMRSLVAKAQLAVAVWALHQHPLFAASSSSQHSSVADLLLLCLQDDADKAVQCLHECCQQLSDSTCDEKVADRSINTLQFFLSNHFSLGLAEALVDGSFHDTLIAELRRFVTSHFQGQGQASPQQQQQPPSPSGVAPSTSLDALARRLALIRCAFGVSPSVSMSMAVLQEVWELVSGPQEREQMFLFLRNAASSTLPSLAAVFDSGECLQIFESLLCSQEIDWTVCGPEAYYCFEAYLSALPPMTPESTRRLGRDQLWQIVLKIPHQTVAEEAVARLLRSYLESATDIDSDEDVLEVSGSASGGPYTELLNRVFDQLATVQSEAAHSGDTSSSIATDPTVCSVVSRCTTLLTGLLGKSKVNHDTPHGVRGSLFRIKVVVRYQEVITSPSMVYNHASSYPSSRTMAKHKTRSLEKTMEVEVHPMHSLHSLQQKIMDKAIVTSSLRMQPRASRTADIRFCHLKLEGSMLPLAHFGIGHDCEVNVLLGGEDGTDNCSDYDDYNYDYYSRNKPPPPVRAVSSDEGSVGRDVGMEASDTSIIGEFTKEDNFHCLLSLVELLDGQSEEASALASGLWTLLMTIPTQPALLQEVERQFHYSREGEEGVQGWEAVLRGGGASSSGVYSTYVLQIMDGMLQPAPELQVDHDIAEVTKDRFISTGGFSTTLAHFVNSSGTSPLGKLFLSIALHVLHYCLFASPQALNDNDGDSSIDGLDLDISHVSLGVDDGDGEENDSVASPMLIAQVQESSSAVLDKLLTVAYNAALSGESEIVKDALGTITSLLESPAIAAQLTSSPQAKGLLTAVLRSSAKPVRHMATNFAVQVGRSQPVVIEWLLAEIEVVAPTDKYCYNLFKALSVLVRYVDDPRNVSGLTLDLVAMGSCLSSKLMVFQHFSLSERLKHKQFELETEADGEKSMLLGSLELLRSVLEVSNGYSAMQETPLGRDLIAIFMQDFLCPLPEEQHKQQEQDGQDRGGGGDKIPICDTKQLRTAAFAVLAACVQAAPEHCSAVMTHIHSLSKSNTASQLLKDRWGLQVAHDLKKSNIEFSGLRNHGCTCYLNSLLQQLFMNQSFRKAVLSVPLKEIYRSTLWHLDDEELVGRQYEFEWAPHGTWHPGCVTRFDPDSKLHTIQYAPGEGQAQGQRSVLDIRQGVQRKGRDSGETGRVRALGLAEEDVLTERESQAVVVLEQLQRTFCYMEKSEKRHFDPKQLIDACKTLNLEFNVYHQNDASEMLDKLLDRLETAMKGKPTGGVDMYAELNTHTFGGKMLYQKIPKECSVYESDKRDCGHWQGTRDEVFFKTEVTVRNSENIDDALEHVVEGELMDGDNKIMCDVCNTKKDTVRRTCFGTLPNCLVVHLKRFDLDYETFETVKLNTRMEFATKLNMYPYTKEGIEAAEEATQEQEEPSLQRTSSKTEEVEVEDTPPVQEVDMEKYAYELQGVLVHSGIAQGGHYYSYIHDGGGAGGGSGDGDGENTTASLGDEHKWYLFDDDEVAPFDPSNIPEQCYGGKFTPGGGGAASSASSDDGMDRHSNALLLFYNKVRPREVEVPQVGDDARSRTISGEEVGSNESKGSDTGTGTGGIECRKVDGYAAFSREVGHSNARHILTKYLIDIDLHNFVRSLLASIATSATAAEAAGGGGDTLVSRGVRFGYHFLLDVVLHCRDRRGARQWVSLLSDIFSLHPDTAVTFLQEFVFSKKSHVLKEFLLSCGDSLARMTFVQVLSGAVAALVPSDATALHEYEKLSDSDLLRAAVNHRGQGPAIVGPPILVLLVHCLISLLQLAPSHVQNCEDLFGAFRALASYPAMCSYMLHREVVPRLLYFVNSGGSKKTNLIKEFYEMAERPTPTGHYRNVGMENQVHHPMVFEAVAALLGVPQQPKADLLEDASLTPQARAALVEIFEEHGQNRPWTTRDVMSYMEFVDEKHSKIALEARNLVDRYGTAGENVIMLEGFLRFSADRAYYNPRLVWKELRAFHFQNNLSRLPPSNITADTAIHLSIAETDTEAGGQLPALTSETMMCLLSGAEVLSIGMSVSELATVAIVTKLSGKHSKFLLMQACKQLLSLQKDWNWQTKDAPVMSLITTLLKIDDDFAPERIDIALTGGTHGLITVLANHRQQQQQHHQQYDVYSSQSLLQRYQDFLKSICAIPHVQEFVHEQAMAAAAEGVASDQYRWLDEQIQQLLSRGMLDTSYLIRELKRTTVQVSGAGEDAVNGNYRFSRLMEYNTALYKKDTTFRNKRVTFQIYRCRMDNQVYQWFISIVPAGKEPGTNADEDFYCKPSPWKPPPTSYQNQHQHHHQSHHHQGASLTLYGGGDPDVKPPEGTWVMVNTNKSCKVKPAPVIRWLVRGENEPEEEEEEEDREEEDVHALVHAHAHGAGVQEEESDSESDKEDSMAVVDDEDRFAVDDDDDEEEEDYLGRSNHLDMIDDDDI